MTDDEEIRSILEWLEGETDDMSDETTTATPERVLELARMRFDAGDPVRGLPKPEGYPTEGWYSTQPRSLADGGRAVYLMYRWRDPVSAATQARSLGRLN